MRLSVPEDVSVAGFDDIPLEASAVPPLATIHQDHTRKELLAGGLLAARLRGEEAPSPDLLPARLVVRGSTGRAGGGRRRGR
jgi:LacI family transcriptional regulator